MTSKELDTAVEMLESSKEEYAALLDIARVIWYQHRDHVEAAEFPEQFLQSYRNREGDDPHNPKTADWYSELEATGILTRREAVAQN